MAMKDPRLDYVELPAASLDKAVGFYQEAFGWTLTKFGPSYAATTTGDTDIGLQGDKSDAPEAPLPVIQVDDVAAAASAVEAAGGDIIRPVYTFPGGRRFHFRDPAGNELAVWQADGE
ncbi:MAG TPA: VOC family protein [Sphingomicrobium sp.]|nr:VOC family protein [Sphingomicrobium sp.]